MGSPTRWTLSHGLFSSYSIDEGTHLLLKTLAANLPLERYKNVLDVGCGIGIIGGVLKKRFPEISVTLQDRDALALHFTDYNFRLNNIQYKSLTGDLALWRIEDEFDLLVSNIPAKAGIPVINDFIRRSTAYIKKDGTVAVVVIHSLRDTVSTAIITNGCRIIYQEHSPNYSVFHFTPKDYLNKPKVQPDSDFSVYLRGKQSFNAIDVNYELDTVYNIDEFDTVSYTTKTLFSVLKKLKLHGIPAVYNPGQGHVPLVLAKKTKYTEQLILLSRDVLSLHTCSYNLEKAGYSSKSIHLPFPEVSFITEITPLDILCIFPEKIPGVSPGEFWPFASSILQVNSIVTFSGTSSLVHQIIKTCPKGFRLIDSHKYRGSRTVLYKKV